MKTIAFSLFFLLIFLLIGWRLEEVDRQDCEIRTAKEVNAVTKYIDGQCFIKGWGAK